MILPDGDWMASFAGFSLPEPNRDDMADVDAENSLETTEPPAELDTMLRELAGRMKTDGERRPLPFDSFPLGEIGVDGC